MSGISTHREIESKLRVHALFELPNFNDDFAVVSEQPFTMVATYYDTPSLALFRWGVTLRRRTGGSDAGWHLKMPVSSGDELVRDEIHLPEANTDHVPAALADVVSPLLLGQPLQQVVVLRTERSPSMIRIPDGACVELVDDTVSVMDGDTAVAVFRELEVEATDDDASRALLHEVVQRLQTAGALVGATSKAASALGPRAAAPPDVRIGPMPGPNGLAADALRVMLATHVKHLLLADVAVRRELPDAVHQMRVAARRLRSVLATFQTLFDREWSAGLREDLKWLASELGAIRDAEVLQERLDEHAETLPADFRSGTLRAIDAVLTRRRDAAQSGAIAALRSDRHDFVIQDLVDAANTPRFTDQAYRTCREALPPSLAKTWRTLERSVNRLELTTPSSHWHAARIKAKRARYAAEALSPIFGKKIERLANRLSDVTEILGSHQDAHVAQQFLLEVVPSADGSTGFGLGLLFEGEYVFEIADREEFLAMWPTVVRAARTSGLIGE